MNQASDFAGKVKESWNESFGGDVEGTVEDNNAQ